MNNSIAIVAFLSIWGPLTWATPAAFEPIGETDLARWEQIGVSNADIQAVINNTNCRSAERFRLGCQAALDTLNHQLVRVKPSMPAEDFDFEAAAAAPLARLADLKTRDSKAYIQLAVTSLRNYMVWAFDGHSQVLPSMTLGERVSGEDKIYYGVGVRFTPSSGGDPIISQVMAGGPADGHLLAGDELLEVERRPGAGFEKLNGWSIAKVSEALQDKEETAVSLIVRREGKTLAPLTIMRGKIVVKNLDFRRLRGNIGYLRLAFFADTSARDVEEAIERMKSEPNQPPLKGLILDLRNNPGGLLNQARDMATLLLPDGKVVTKLKSKRIPYFNGFFPTGAIETGVELNPDTAIRGIKTDLPLVVLINERTMSAAELLAGALRDYERAILVGTRSAGKGSFQITIPLKDLVTTMPASSIASIPFANRLNAGPSTPELTVVLTTALFYQPVSEKSVQIVGLLPHFTRYKHPGAALPSDTSPREADLVDNLPAADGTAIEVKPAPELAKCVSGKHKAEDIYNSTPNKLDADYQLESGLDVAECL